MQMPEIDLVDLAQTVARQRRVFFGVIAGFVLITLLVLHFISPKYTETMTVAPVVDSNSQLSGGLGALAKLGGVNLNSAGGGQGQFQLFLGSLTVRKTADSLAEDQALMHRLFADDWNASEQHWNRPSGVLHAVIGIVKFVLGSPDQPWHPPNGENVQAILENNLQIDTDEKSPFVKLSMQSAKPDVTSEFLTKLVRVADKHLQERALVRANSYIAYLTKEFDTVTVAEYRAALAGHLTEQEQVRMMASANVSFAAQTFSPPSRSAAPTAPKRTLLLIFALLVGAGVGVGAAVRTDRRQSRTSKLAMRSFGQSSVHAD